MTRMTRPDCAVMCNLINTHTHTHTHRLPDRSRLWTGVNELFFGRGGPYEKLAALPAANVRVSDIQHAVQPYISGRRATPGNMGRIYVFISS